ncbi:MAG: hypothetical protein K2L73_01915 [Muribaculaceae bacterium]|nr:hypothetical protein [Muribaculaceae bacterium]
MKRTLNPDFIKSIDALRSLAGGDAACRLIDSLQSDEPSVAVRVNPLKRVTVPETKRRVEWSRCGVYIDGERPRFTFDPALHQGLYYVQDPSSMIIESVVSALTADGKPVVYIDSCAAPGGKTTAAISSLPPGSFVIANEYDRRRAEALVENVIKWGSPCVAVTSGDTARFASLGPVADIVAADVPCSGEGMMRKEEAAVEQWSPALVQQCAALQREIIDNMWQALKPGGYFIYSTCTFNRLEDEENVEYIVEHHGGRPVDLQLSERFAPIAGAIGSSLPVARFLPGRVDGEGLFLAVLQKPGDTHGESAGHSRRRKERPTTKHEAAPDVARWVNGDGYELSRDGDRIIALPAAHAQFIKELGCKLNIIYAGTEVGTVKGRDVIPSQALALSECLCRNAFPAVDVDYTTALMYLSRQATTLPDGTPRGIVLLTYAGRPLGFVKNLGNRANNLYPASWAIRSTHIPDNPVDIIR